MAKGRHAGPEDGACVMELASMLADEPFSDRPKSVCPVIGAFLRAYNDSIDNARRQDLYAYAAKVVGSRGSAEVCQARVERLTAWSRELRRRRRLGRALRPSFLPVLSPDPCHDYAGVRAVHAIKKHDDQTHAEVLSLIDELLALGAGADSARWASTLARDGQPMPEPAPRPAQSTWT
jgi:hypothetical protein